MDNIVIVDDEEEILNRGNNLFPWMAKITNMCKDAILDPNIKRLDELIATFLTDVEKDVKQCYCKPKRAEKLKTRINSILIFFHAIYLEIKKPLEHTSYLDKISDIMALYIDLELKSSKRKREDPKKISHRICSCLFIFIDKSIDHMLDAVLKSRYFGKIQTYNNICEPIIARLLKECPGCMYDINYMRYLLSFKLWKKMAGKKRFAAIHKEAVVKLRPPPGFFEKLKSGAFANVLPYVAKSEKDRLTSFFMQCPFNIKKKAEVFLKESRKSHPIGEFDDFSLDEDLESSNYFEFSDFEPQVYGSSLEIMEGMWNQLRGRDLNAIDEILSCDSLEDTNRLMVELNIVSKNATNPQPTKMKLGHSETKLLNVDSSGNGNNVFIETIPKEEKTSPCCIKAEDTSNNDESKLKPSLNSLTNKTMKPCATVEPVESETCKGMEADSLTDTHSPTVVRSTVISGEQDVISEKNSCSVELNPVVSSQTNIPDINSTEANDAHRQTAVNSSVISGDNNDISGTKSSNNVDLSPIVSSVTNTTVSNQISEVNLSDEGNVSASDELNQLKADQIAPLISVEGLVCNNYEGVLEFNNEVAETIEIGNTSDVTLDVLMDEDIQTNRLDQRAILNVIGVSNDMLNIPAESIIFPRKVQLNKDISALEKQKSTSDGKNDINDGNANDPTSTSPENQVLSSYLVSSDQCENYVPLGLNTYLYNDSMISHYLAEVNADEVSDDEERFPGKLGAFRDQTKDSKSDSEEFETPTPESHTDSISAAEASPGINAQLSSTQQINRFEEEINPQNSHEVKESEINDNQGKQVAPNLDCPQLKKRVSVEVTSLDMDLVKGGKMNSKGMFESSVSSLHSKTVTLDENYEVLVDNHFSLTLNSNVYNSTNLPPIPHPSYERRCQCTICTKKYICLVGKYQQLLFSITRMEEDVKLSKLEEVHAQQDLLLKSIQDSLNDDAESENKTENNDEEKKTTMDKFITETNKEDVQHPETIHQSLNNEMNYHKDKIDLEREDASELQTKSCLPPKKRKSFSLPLRPMTKSKKNDSGFSTVDKLRSNCENDNNNDQANGNVIKTNLLNINDMTENSNKAVSENGEKIFKTKIVAIDGSYCVIPQCTDSTLNTNVELSGYFNNDSTSSKENKTKSCCYRKRKEEKKLRREKKRLKRQKKEKLREMSSKSSS